MVRKRHTYVLRLKTTRLQVVHKGGCACCAHAYDQIIRLKRTVLCRHRTHFHYYHALLVDMVLKQDRVLLFGYGLHSSLSKISIFVNKQACKDTAFFLFCQKKVTFS